MKKSRPIWLVMTVFMILYFKFTMPTDRWLRLWLWFCFFWPILLVIVLLVIEVLWAIALRVSTWRIRRRNRQEAGKVPKSRPEAESTVGEIIWEWWAASSRNHGRRRSSLRRGHNAVLLSRGAAPHGTELPDKVVLKSHRARMPN